MQQTPEPQFLTFPVSVLNRLLVRQKAEKGKVENCGSGVEARWLAVWVLFHGSHLGADWWALQATKLQ
jgi:hypothetical protein